MQWKSLPSVVDVEVLNFHGSFDESYYLGRAEINFLKQTAQELSDYVLPCRGKLAQASHARLHLRVFLDNSRGDNTVREYLARMEKKVGRKVRNSRSFRFSLLQPFFLSVFYVFFVPMVTKN